MDHAAAQDLQPVAALADDQLVARATAADIDLGRGLGEREVAGAEADRHVVALEIGAHEIGQAALQVPHVHAPVDQQPLDLMEHRRVGGVAVAAVGAAGGDDPERRLAGQHGADLHRAGVGAQQQRAAVDLGVEVERVEHLPRRMLRRDVERLEIVPVVLDVGAFRHGKAHVGEDRHDLLGGLAHRVDSPKRPLARRQRDVDPLGLQPRRQRGLLQHRPARRQRLLDLALDRVERLARLAPLFRRQRAQLLDQLGHPALLAERRHAEVLQRAQVAGLCQLRQDLAAEIADIDVHPCLSRLAVATTKKGPEGPSSRTGNSPGDPRGALTGTAPIKPGERPRPA